MQALSIVFSRIDFAFPFKQQRMNPTLDAIFASPAKSAF
jgi:hypothetical protein